MQQKKFYSPTSPLPLSPAQRQSERLATAERRQRRAVLQWAKQRTIDRFAGREVTTINLTLKRSRRIPGMSFTPEYLTEEQALFEVKKLEKNLNRLVLRRAYRRGGMKLNFEGRVEKAKITGRLHIHCAVEIPFGWTHTRMKAAILRAWEKSSWAAPQLEIVAAHDALGWAKYISKDGVDSQVL